MPLLPMLPGCGLLLALTHCHARHSMRCTVCSTARAGTACSSQRAQHDMQLLLHRQAVGRCNSGGTWLLQPLQNARWTWFILGWSVVLRLLLLHGWRLVGREHHMAAEDKSMPCLQKTLSGAVGC